LAESYLFEFVLAQVLVPAADRFAEINDYFPPGRYRGVEQKWKEVPQELVRVGRIPAVPTNSDRAWQDFVRVVDFRNGLVHGRASRPRTSELPPNHLPIPTVEDLDQMTGGWALGVVLTQIRKLQAAAAMPTPEWFPLSG
jgi:hypothetical protein